MGHDDNAKHTVLKERSLQSLGCASESQACYLSIIFTPLVLDLGTAHAGSSNDLFKASLLFSVARYFLLQPKAFVGPIATPPKRKRKVP